VVYEALALKKISFDTAKPETHCRYITTPIHDTHGYLGLKLLQFYGRWSTSSATHSRLVFTQVATDSSTYTRSHIHMAVSGQSVLATAGSTGTVLRICMSIAGWPKRETGVGRSAETEKTESESARAPHRNETSLPDCHR
jgi:hypothetical protein